MNIFRRKPFLGNLILVVISFSLSLFLSEIVIRQFIPIDLGTSFAYRIPHPTLGWVLKPGVSYRNHMVEATVGVTYNSKGWRDVEHAIDAPHGAFRALVLGDSFIEGYSVELNDALHKRVEEFARQRGGDVEVINLGVGGYGTLQEYLAFQEVGQLYQPKLVLLGFYIGNDVRNNSFELESIVNTGTMKVESRPFLDANPPPAWRITPIDFEGAQRRYAAAQTRQNTFPQKLASRSALVQLSERGATRLVRMLSSTVEQFAKAHSAPSLAEQARDLAHYGVHYCLEPAEYTRAWEITKRILARLKRDTEASGGRLFVFTVPALEEVSVPAMDRVRAHAPNPDKLCLEEATAYGRLTKLLKELKIEYVNLLPHFRRVMRDDGTNLFRRSDSHWNPAGHSLAAQLIVSTLIEKNMLLLRKSDTAQQSAAADARSSRR